MMYRCLVELCQAREREGVSGLMLILSSKLLLIEYDIIFILSLQ